MRLPLTMLAVVLLTVPARASELTGTLQKVKETNRIVLGFQEASVPFSYLDGNQKAIGYAVDICLKIVDAVKHQFNLSNVTVETLPVTSSNRIPLMMNGTVDLVCSSTTNNAETAAPGGVHEFTFSVGNAVCRAEDPTTSPRSTT